MNWALKTDRRDKIAIDGVWEWDKTWEGSGPGAGALARDWLTQSTAFSKKEEETRLAR